jgi:hypothetical protein
MKPIILILMTMLLTACAATPYQAMKWDGGYEESVVNPHLTKICFKANNLTPGMQIKEYVLLRAAEIGKQKNRAYFAVYKNLADAANDIKSDPCISRELTDWPVAYAYILYSNSKSPEFLSVADVLKCYNKYK